MPEIVLRISTWFGWAIREYREEIIAIGTAIIAVYTAVLAGIGRNQSKETRILQRAYVSVEPDGIHAHHQGWGDGRIGQKGPLRSLAHVTIKNSGRLPARKIAWTIEHKFSDERYLDDFPFSTLKPIGEGTLPPSSKMRQGGHIINGGDGDEELRIKPERFLYVWGIVTYEDGFTTSRSTKFCHRYNCGNVETVHGKKQADAGGKGPIIGLIVLEQFARIHRYGNDAD